MGLRNAPLAWLFAAAWLGCRLGGLPAGQVLGGFAGWLAAAVALLGAATLSLRRLVRYRTAVAAAALALACAAAVAARLAHHAAHASSVTRGESGVFAGYLIDAAPSSSKGLSLRLRPLSAPRGLDVELLASPAEVERALSQYPPAADGRIEWPVRLYPYRPPGNPWEFDARMRAAEQGLVARAYFEDPIADPFWAVSAPPGCLEEGALLRLLSPIRRLAWRWRCSLYEALPERTLAVALAMVLGQKDLLTQELRDAFSRSGTAHLLAVSGVHVGFVAMAALAMLGPLARGARAASRRVLAIGLAGLAVGGYVLLVGGPPSALRAGLTAVAAFAARAMGKKPDSFQTLGAAGVALLLVEPLYAFDLGFQLSFGATAGILVGARLVKAMPGGARGILRGLNGGGLRGAGRGLAASLILSAAPQALTLPAAMGAFSTLPWLSPLVNLAAIPAGAVSILATGAGLIAGEINGWAGALLIEAGGLGILGLTALADAVPPWGAFEVAAPAIAFSVGWYALTIGVVQALICAGRPSNARSWIGGRRLAVLGALLIACASAEGVIQSARGDVLIVVLDVGQGDSVLIRGPWGRSVLVDGGPYTAGGYDAGLHRVVPALKRLGVRTLDAVVSTHPDSDHVGGLAAVLRHRKVRRVYASWAESNTAAYRRFVEAAESQGLSILRFSAGDVLPLGPDARIEVLASGDLREWEGFAGSPTVNDRSVVISVVNGETRFLLLGDTEDKGAARLMEEFDLEADGLLIPHHGSPGAFWGGFLDRIEPRLAAISVGPNSFGHPSGELLATLEERAIQFARTDLCGAITVVLRRTGASMSVYRPADCRRGA